ncbi:DUF2637 domain-containing protein [Glaciibacter psychrotolerans]|uniref:DUF2637 domain-containing protein n=1 Tax=Glaciibacter psychrotolerans TaxID=670054 RepID=A0A7Z0EBD2_9MICO|nr:DUF2637 domain-containing protein [Leifsonia psychrotolerans]NYJ18528.1 hypothetical protein [Leifsonia psychrotolerans]
MVTAVVGTVFIAAGAFWLSFTSLADLARRSGIDASRAWIWPLIVDGIIVVATVAAVALARSRAAWYPWMLLSAGAAISVAANAIHAIVAGETSVPLLLVASVSAVPPRILLAITHLTSVLMRHEPAHVVPPAQQDVPESLIETTAEMKSSSTTAGQTDALALRALGWSNSAIAQHAGVHPSTVGRWIRGAVGAPPVQIERAREEPNDE